MERLGNLAGIFIEDVNKEDSAILDLFDMILNFLFKTILVAGVPFFLYVLIQFAGLF